MRIRGFVAAAAAGLLLAACGSSGKTASDVPTTTTVATAPNTPAQLATDKATAVASVLRRSDLTAGYKQIPPNPSSDDDFPPAVLTKFASCAHLSKEQAKKFFDQAQVKQPQAESHFMKKDGELLETDFDNTVELDRSAHDISEPFDLLKQTPAKCWQGLFEAAFAQSPPEGATVSGVKVTSLSTLGLGDQALAFRVGVNISAPGLTVRSTIDLYFVGRGRAGVTLTATGVGRPADPAFERSMLEKVLQRVDAAASPAAE
jgi:hypothetical protein